MVHASNEQPTMKYGNCVNDSCNMATTRTCLHFGVFFSYVEGAIRGVPIYGCAPITNKQTKTRHDYDKILICIGEGRICSSNRRIPPTAYWTISVHAVTVVTGN